MNGIYKDLLRIVFALVRPVRNCSPRGLCATSRHPSCHSRSAAYSSASRKLACVYQTPSSFSLPLTRTIMPAYRTRDASARSKSPLFSSPLPLPAAPSSTNLPLVPARRRAALEVSTDAPPPPTVSIISPTPRAFTFPIHDTRFPNSPSSSPFEPTLKSIPSTPPPLRPFSPTSSIGSDSSISVLSSPTAPPSSQASSHRRRRSTVSDIGERRPKKGDDDYIKRPENAFILFRRKKCEERQAAQDDDDGSSGPVKKQRQADLSKTISQQWKSLAAEERQYWEDLAKEKKKEHEAMYPNYVYRPQRTKDKKNKKGKSRGEHDTDTESFSFLLPVSSSPSRSLSRDFAPSHGHGHGRRAASAPTPPPAFQAIQLPTVWMPSCPTSPSLVPRISGRSPAPMANIPPPTESAPLTTFDYAPNDHLFMPSYQPHCAFDGSGLQVRSLLSSPSALARCFATAPSSESGLCADDSLYSSSPTKPSLRAMRARPVCPPPTRSHPPSSPPPTRTRRACRRRARTAARSRPPTRSG
ncbi:hypothetical protein C8T65DRAFT_642960 [Cerioporus squamosus]|nr:hypothetical protein C8T65DRAFT_642960 [Cerioporus squamosus]